MNDTLRLQVVLATAKITEWKKQLLDRAPEVFDKEKKPSEPDIKELHAKIGQLATENDFLSIALGEVLELPQFRGGS